MRESLSGSLLLIVSNVAVTTIFTEVVLAGILNWITSSLLFLNDLGVNLVVEGTLSVVVVTTVIKTSLNSSKFAISLLIVNLGLMMIFAFKSK